MKNKIILISLSATLFGSISCNDFLDTNIVLEIKKGKKASIVIDTNVPCFPFDEPREYQKLAFESWKKNKQKGLFAMATGTGKTITSLNCLLEIFLTLLKIHT